MEWIHQDLSRNLRSDVGKRTPGSGLGAAVKDGTAPLGSERQPEDWCDSGLDSLISAEFISIDAPDPGHIPAGHSGPAEPWSSERCGGTLDGTETERLDSAIGDSISDDTVSGLSERIGTVTLSEATRPQGRQPGPEVQDPRGEEIFHTLSFLSEDGDT